MEERMHGPMTEEQQQAFDACERSLQRAENLAPQNLDSQIQARIFLDFLERGKQGQRKVNAASLEHIRTELLNKGSEEVTRMVMSNRDYALAIMSLDPRRDALGKIKQEMAQRPFESEIQSEIGANVKRFVEQALIPPLEKKENQEVPGGQDQDRREPPDGMNPSSLKFKAWQRGTQGFEREYSDFLEECHLDAVAIPDKQKIYYHAFLENIQEIAGMAKESPYPFYYLDLARGFFQFIRTLAESGFDFIKGYKNFKRYRKDEGKKRKDIPATAHNILQDVQRNYLDSDKDYTNLLFVALFKNIPLTLDREGGYTTTFKDRIGELHEQGYELDEFSDLYYFRKTTPDEENAKGLPERKILKQQWPHLKFFG